MHRIPVRRWIAASNLTFSWLQDNEWAHIGATYRSTEWTTQERRHLSICFEPPMFGISLSSEDIILWVFRCAPNIVPYFRILYRDISFYRLWWPPYPAAEYLGSGLTPLSRCYLRFEVCSFLLEGEHRVISYVPQQEDEDGSLRHPTWYEQSSASIFAVCVKFLHAVFQIGPDYASKVRRKTHPGYGIFNYFLSNRIKSVLNV